MRQSVVRGFITILFIGLLAAPLIYRRITAQHGAATETANRAADLAQYGFVMKESAKASGIAFTHSAPTLDPKLGHIMEQVASMGAAVSVVDFDGDGWDDIYVINSGEGETQLTL